jgi:hypothetical protein
MDDKKTDLEPNFISYVVYVCQIESMKRLKLTDSKRTNIFSSSAIISIV